MSKYIDMQNTITFYLGAETHQPDSLSYIDARTRYTFPCQIGRFFVRHKSIIVSHTFLNLHHFYTFYLFLTDHSRLL